MGETSAQEEEVLVGGGVGAQIRVGQRWQRQAVEVCPPGGGAHLAARHPAAAYGWPSPLRRVRSLATLAGRETTVAE